MIKQTLLLFTFAFSCLAVADSDLDQQFRRELRSSMEKIFGAGAITAEQFFTFAEGGAIESGSTETGKIAQPLGYIQLKKNDLLCRVGMGVTRSASGQLLKTALAECLPLHQEAGAESVTLQSKFAAVREMVLLLPTKFDHFVEKANANLATVMRDPGFDLANYSYTIVDRSIQPATLFYFQEPDANANALGNPKFETYVTIEFEAGPKVAMRSHVPVWQLELPSLADSSCRELTTRYAQREPLSHR